MAQGNSASTTQQSSNTSSNGAVASNTHSSQMWYNVAQLDDDGKKYTAWAQTMMLVLQWHSLWNVVSSVAPAPNVTADPDAYKAWLNLDQEALIQIILALKEGPQNCILNVAMAKECWDTLAEQYKAKDDQQAIFLMEKLFMTQFSDSESLEPQLDQMRLTTHMPMSVGFPLDDKWLTGIMVMKLPESMVMLKAILSHTDSTKLTSTAVTNEILIDEACWIHIGCYDHGLMDCHLCIPLLPL
jgi:gag-polypeptide of LTR copia-type